MEENSKNRTIHNHFAEGSNCQVFNGDISGCVFAMPNATVTQQPAGCPSQSMSEEEEGIVSQLRPIFFGMEEEARAFLAGIRGMKPTEITAKVNKWVKDRKISDKSYHRDLWKVLHECGIYAPSESNWNQQVK